MHCPFCRNPDSRVIDSRTSDDGLSIRRRRQCPECGGRFSTVETASLNVIKRSGVIEPFSREKVISGVRKACQGRPVTDSDLAVLAQKVEEAVRRIRQKITRGSDADELLAQMRALWDEDFVPTRDKVADEAYEMGMMILGCGRLSVRFRPPLDVTAGEIDEALNILEAAAAKVTGR